MSQRQVPAIPSLLCHGMTVAESCADCQLLRTENKETYAMLDRPREKCTLISGHVGRNIQGPTPSGS